MDFKDQALIRHKALRGKIAVTTKDKLTSKDQLSVYYTPGVGAVSDYVASHPETVREYTWVGNTVAVVSDGSAVLGLGDIGPKGALPVMEGKAMIFKEFAGIDAVPIVLDVHDADGIVNAVMAIAPSFGGINLEDIAAPKCFEVERRLKERLEIPVMHDDQHGTAVVALAALINAMKVTKRSLKSSRIVLLGAGAAGVAIANLLHKYGVTNLVVVDSKGIVSKKRADLTTEKEQLLSISNPENLTGGLEAAMAGADVFIGVSKANVVTEGMVRSMAKDPIIFAMANPVPEILPDVARNAGAMVVATGRSDFANQINNSLAFPGIFRGALDNNVREITDEHKLAAAEAIAGLVEDPRADCIVPDTFDLRLVPAVASVFKQTSPATTTVS